MATNPIGGSLPPVTLPNLLSTFDRNTLASAIEVLVAVVDAMDGDADHEDCTDLEDDFALSPMALGFDTGRGPGCAISDPGGIDNEHGPSWPEFHTLTPKQQARDYIPHDDEDEEDDDPKEVDDQDKAVDDDGCDDNWDDREEEQMANDVPMLATYSLDHNFFTDKREFLGISNLMTSYRTNGGTELSADTGGTIRTIGRQAGPSVPV